MCTNALNCTHSPLIDVAELLRSTGQILQRVKHGPSDRLNSPEQRRSFDFQAWFITHFYCYVNAAQTFFWEAGHSVGLSLALHSPCVVITGGRSLYSNVVFHLGRTDSWGVFGLGTYCWEEAHSLNQEWTSLQDWVNLIQERCNPKCLVPRQLPLWGHVICSGCTGGSGPGHVRVTSYSAVTWLLLEGNSAPSPQQLESSLDFPVLLFVSADSDVTFTRCFPSSLWWKDHHGWHFLSCSNFLTVRLSVIMLILMSICSALFI